MPITQFFGVLANPLFAFALCGFRFFAFGNIMDKRGEIGRSRCGDMTDRQLNGEDRAIGAHRRLLNSPPENFAFA